MSTVSAIQTNMVLSIAQLFPHPRNYRQHSEAQLRKLRASLERFGQARSIVVIPNTSRGYTIVAGHGVVDAARSLHWSQLRADVLPETWTEQDIVGYLIADNTLSSDAEDDEYILMELLQLQQHAGYSLESLGLYDGALEDIVAKLTPPTLDQLAETFGDEPDDEDFWPVIKVKVSPAVKRTYDAIAQGRDDASKFQSVLDAAHQHMTKADGTGPLLFLPQATIQLAVEPPVRQLYDRVMGQAPGATDSEKFTSVLETAEAVWSSEH